MPENFLNQIKSFTLSDADSDAPLNLKAFETLKASLEASQTVGKNGDLLNIALILAFYIAAEQNLRQQLKSTRERATQSALHEQVDLWGAVDAFSKMLLDYCSSLKEGTEPSAGSEMGAFLQVMRREAEACLSKICSALLRAGRAETYGNLIAKLQSYGKGSNNSSLPNEVVNYLDSNY